MIRIAIARTIFIGGVFVHAASPKLENAVRPMEEGVPQVAVMRLRALLSEDIGADERVRATSSLGEALLAAGEPAQALEVLKNPALMTMPSARFCRAQALAALGRWSEALSLYQQVTTDGTLSLRSKGTLGQADALRALNRSDEALQLLKGLFSDPLAKDRAGLRAVELLLEKGETTEARRILDKTKPVARADKKEKRFLQGQIEAQLDHRVRAIELFQTILKRPEGTDRPVFVATLCAFAENNLRVKTPEAGDDALEDFVEHYPTDPELPTIFKRLDRLYQAQRTPSNQELRRWANDSTTPKRRALATWYLAKGELNAGRQENALRIFHELRSTHPIWPALTEGYLQFARLELNNGHFDEALAILDEARELGPDSATLRRVNLLAGSVHYGARRFKEAAETFETVARATPGFSADAFYNASLAWLQLGDHPHFLADYDQVNQGGANEPARGDLLAEEGLIQAAQGNKNAADTLRKFLQEFPHHGRRAEAWLALAELAFHAVPADLATARKALASAMGSEPNEAIRERADYLAIWIEDTAPNSDVAGVIRLANNFLQAYPHSSLVSDVRMKLAETYYRQQDFPNAQTQFQVLAQENPKAGFTEKALFYAAKSAIQSMDAQSLDRALVLLDEVVKRNGGLKWTARNEQAVIERRLGKPHDAATLYDEVLAGTANPEEKREAICGKGDILYEAGSTDSENYRRAIELYDQLASQKEVARHWRNQVLFKKGSCLEKLNESDNALATFYEIIEDESPAPRRREFFWYYKAGFSAARLLEDDSKWSAAAAVYQKLASAGGARSDEAKARLNRLRLEHFLWDQ